jgi:hypothetical protein
MKTKVYTSQFHEFVKGIDESTIERQLLGPAMAPFYFKYTAAGSHEELTN